MLIDTTLKKNITADSFHKLSGNFVILSTNKRKPELKKIVQSFVAFLTTSVALYKQSAQHITLVPFVYNVNRICYQLQKYQHHGYTPLLNNIE
jgi:hypothetical protein